jgi:hypothetical protein
VEPPAPEPTDTPARQPRAEYQARLENRRAAAARHARYHQHIANARLAVFLIAGAIAWLAFGANQVSAWWLGLPAELFVVLLVLHARVARGRVRAERATAYYEKAIARLDEHWIGTGEPGTRYLDGDHPYAEDLDLFGTGSVFERLCTARTRIGQDTLAAWLKGPAQAAEARARQSAVADLRPRLDLREDLALLGAGVPAGVNLAALAAWGDAPPVHKTSWPRGIAALLAALNVLLIVAWPTWGTGPLPAFAALFLSGCFALGLWGRVQRIIGPVEKMAHDLAIFAGILAHIEREPCSAPRLLQLRSALDTASVSASGRIAQLFRLVDLLNSKQNQFFAAFALILMWDTQLSYAVERWRKASGPAIRRWLEAVGEFEALCALAGYAYENPADPFPEVVDECPRFEGDELGHPLIPHAKCVRNNVQLTPEMRLLVVSGSNMSGKSTLLRTVGVNAVLALAGAPVRAKRLRISALAVGATLRVQDSLQAGRSRFFAEITRIRQLVDLARGPIPLLFLLDEIFGGTNSHDRRLGAEAVVRSLVNYGAIGLVTTHDLALTHIVDLLAPRAANVHFEDHFENGAITFDYLMRPDVVKKSNALALMRAVGLEV